MRRVVRFFVRNWPLKLGAIVLATLLYSGLVLSQSVRLWTGEVRVDPIRPPAGATLLSDLEPVTVIRFRAPLDVGIMTPESFRATADLSQVAAQPGGAAQEVPITVIALDRRVQIVDFQPQVAQVRLDPVEERELPVTVTHGTVPQGVSVGPPQSEPAVVTVRGASSRVASIRSIVARVTIDASALNIDRSVELEAIDDQANRVSNVEIEPSQARVRIAVAVELANRSLPVVPDLIGEPAAGHFIAAIDVQPLTVTVSGSESIVTHLEAAPTAPIDVTGLSTDLETVVELMLPDQVEPIGSRQVRVTVAISENRASRTFLAGVSLTGARPDLSYVPAVTQLAVTLSGPLAALNDVDPAQLLAVVDVTDLEADSHVLPVTVTPPAGLELLSVAPPEVRVRIEATETDAGSTGSRDSLAGRLL